MQAANENKSLNLHLSPQASCPPLPSSKKGFLSDRLPCEKFLKPKIPLRKPNISLTKLLQQSKPPILEIKENISNPMKNSSISMMTRMNWLIELKILYDELAEHKGNVAVIDLINLIQERKNDLILIEEETYYATHSEIGLTPSDIIISLQNLNKISIVYDELFNLISKISHNSQKNQNVRSSTEHIIETARFNKQESEKSKELMKKDDVTPLKPNCSQNKDHSPLSFSMSAIKMAETPGSKTFTLSELGGDFLNLKLNDSIRRIKKKELSISKTCSTFVLSQVNSQETILNKKKTKPQFDLKKEGLCFAERLNMLNEKEKKTNTHNNNENFKDLVESICVSGQINEKLAKQLQKFVVFNAFNKEKKYGFCFENINENEWELNNQHFLHLLSKSFVIYL